MSHRGKPFQSIAQKTEKDFRELLSIPKEFKIFFYAGGASQQNTAIPLNMLQGKTVANYVTTGHWSKQSILEAKKYCKANEVWPDSKGVF